MTFKTILQVGGISVTEFFNGEGEGDFVVQVNTDTNYSQTHNWAYANFGERVSVLPDVLRFVASEVERQGY
jgi:hypothetical protein